MLLKALLLVGILRICQARPPTTTSDEESQAASIMYGLVDNLEYHRYIREVVNALESDPTFREKLEKTSEEEIRSGKIANELDLISHHVRSRLDEIKRTELQRLRDLMARKFELAEHQHLDHKNQHTFEVEDLKKLIAKSTEDLAEADKKRRAEFKRYELQKEYERMAKLNESTGQAREKLMKKYKRIEQKHKKHERLHEPGRKRQLEEVWKEQDRMQQEFNPKTFFVLHDLDSNGLWDHEEVKALFVKELDKMYAEGAPEDDMRERAEEMERMRESVFNEIDSDKDGFIDYPEFWRQTKKNHYGKDDGWQGLDEQRPFVDEEFDEYVRHAQKRNTQQAGPASKEGETHLTERRVPTQPMPQDLIGPQDEQINLGQMPIDSQDKTMPPQGDQMIQPSVQADQQINPVQQDQMNSQGERRQLRKVHVPPEALQEGQIPLQDGEVYPQSSHRRRGQMPPEARKEEQIPLEGGGSITIPTSSALN